MPPVSGRVLFVDDEVRILDGIRGLLRKQRHRWTMDFAVGGEAALEVLAKESYDVVVTDLRMPKVDGLALLQHLRERHPDTIRIVLSGDPERETALKVVPHAHRVLTKPCQASELESALNSARMLRELVSDEQVRRALGRVGDLPPLPQTYARLVRALEKETAGVNEVAEVIASDVAVSAKLLQIANSALFANGRAIANLTSAVSLIGVETLKTLVLSSALCNNRALPEHVRRLTESLTEHSLVVAKVAAELAPDPITRRDAFTAGMLHDVGRMVLALEMSPGECENAFASPDGEAGSCAEHARVGAYLLGLWGLPLEVIEAVALHHEGYEASPVATAVHRAEEILFEVAHREVPSASDLETVLEAARSDSVSQRRAPSAQEAPP